MVIFELNKGNISIHVGRRKKFLGGLNCSLDSVEPREDEKSSFLTFVRAEIVRGGEAAQCVARERFVNASAVS